MSEAFFDGEHCVLDRSRGVPLAEWLDGSEGDFAIHPDGFPVFLRPTQLKMLDEYSQADPYGVIQHGGVTAFSRSRLESTKNLIRSWGRPIGRMLDVGCGQGHLCNMLRESLPLVEAHAFDGSLTAITQASGQYPHIQFAVADAFCPPYPRDAFDLIVLNNIWEHVTDPIRMLVALRPSLRPDGIVVISTPSRFRISNLIRVAMGKRPKLRSSLHVTEYSVEQVKEQLHWAGFDIQEIQSSAAPKAGLAHFRSRVLRSPLQLWQWAAGSSHVWEATAFFLATVRR